MLGPIANPNGRQGFCSQSLQERNCSHSCRGEFWGLHPECREGLGALRHQVKISTARNYQEKDTVKVKET